jgi:hypothetical protein
MTQEQQTIDAIDQADWMEAQTSYSLDELYADDPDLFVVLATEWREAHQDGGWETLDV